MDIYAIITNAVRDYLIASGGSEPEKNIIQIQKTRKEFDGDLTLVVFPLLRITKKSLIGPGYRGIVGGEDGEGIKLLVLLLHIPNHDLLLHNATAQPILLQNSSE